MTNSNNIYDSFESAGIYGVNYNNIEQKLKCPKCGDDRKNKADKSLSVSIKKGIWVCHHCEWKGRLKNQDYVAPIEKNYVKPKSFISKVSSFWVDWFKARGIQEHVLEYFELGEFEYGGHKWIKFPYKRNKELINAKSRSDIKEFRLSPGSELIFFNLDAIKDKKECVITEGEIDCMSLYQSNIFNAVSVPNGASKGSMKLEYLDNCSEYFSEMEKVILFTDNDEAGLALREELARRIGRDKCFIVKYPSGCKDANEILQLHGSEFLNNVVRMSEPHPVEDVSKPSNSREKIKEYRRDGFPEGDKLGYSNFDNLLSFRPGELTIITGIPNCFYSKQLIETDKGQKEISKVNIGDKVLSYNHKTKNNEYKTVLDTMVNQEMKKKMILIKMKDGTEIKVTEDHKFFDGVKYTPIIEILNK